MVVGWCQGQLVWWWGEGRKGFAAVALCGKTVSFLFPGAELGGCGEVLAPSTGTAVPF